MKLSFVKRLFFSMAASVLGLLLLEGGLRLFDYEGESDRVVSWCREHAKNRAPFFREEDLGDTRAWVPLFEGQPRPMPEHKEEDTLRIFALGGSAVHGYGFTRPGSWPDKLEERLAMAWPGRRVEVINAGAIAWSSQQLLSLAKDILENHEPDALVVLSGNNELLEWFDARKYLPPSELHQWVDSIRSARSMRRFRIYQLLTDWFGGSRGHWGQTSFTDDEALDWSLRARMRNGDRSFAEESFRYNLGRILEEARRSDVPVVLGTVPVNWLEPPAEFPFKDAIGAAERRRGDEAERRLREGDLSLAQEQMRRLMKEHPEAILAYRFGRVARDLGHTELAREWLKEAIRLDENPHRTLPQINGVIHSLSGRSEAFVDVEALLEKQQEDGILDGDVVYDYCHLRPDAHALVAEAIGLAFVETVWPGGRLTEAPAAPESHLDGWLGEEVKGNEGPFSLSPGLDRKQWWQTAEMKTKETPLDASAWLELARISWHSFHGQCSPERGPCLTDALFALDKALALDPQLCEALAARGRIAYALSENDAVERLGKAVDCDPGDARSRWYLKRLAWETVQ